MVMVAAMDTVADMGKDKAIMGTAMAAMTNRNIKAMAMAMEKGTAATGTVMVAGRNTEGMATVTRFLAAPGFTVLGTTTRRLGYWPDRSRLAASREGVWDGSTPFSMAR